MATGGWGEGVLLLKFGVLFDEPLPPQAANPNRAVQKTVTVFKAVFFIILIPFFERLPPATKWYAADGESADTERVYYNRFCIQVMEF